MITNKQLNNLPILPRNLHEIWPTPISKSSPLNFTFDRSQWAIAMTKKNTKKKLRKKREKLEEVAIIIAIQCNRKSCPRKAPRPETQDQTLAVYMCVFTCWSALFL